MCRVMEWGGGLSLELRVREKILGLLRFGCGGAKKVGGVGGGGGCGPSPTMAPGAWGYIQALRKSTGFDKPLFQLLVAGQYFIYLCNFWGVRPSAFTGPGNIEAPRIEFAGEASLIS